MAIVNYHKLLVCNGVAARGIMVQQALGDKHHSVLLITTNKYYWERDTSSVREYTEQQSAGMYL